jgi:hypothetical protein
MGSGENKIKTTLFGFQNVSGTVQGLDVLFPAYFSFFESLGARIPRNLRNDISWILVEINNNLFCIVFGVVFAHWKL